MPAWSTENRRPQFKKNDKDPQSYGKICPHCNKRYGDANHLGYIEIIRCGTCPTFKDYDKFYKGAEKMAEYRYNSKMRF